MTGTSLGNSTEIYTFAEAALLAGQKSIPVHIFPFRMTLLNMSKYLRFPEHGFWRQLRPIYAAFEANQQIPKVKIENGIYKLR